MQAAKLYPSPAVMSLSCCHSVGKVWWPYGAQYIRQEE